MKKSLFILGIATLSACKPNLKVDAPNANGLDFSNYIAVGNSLTAGYTDGTLYRSGQINSYPNILASQFGVFGPIEFVQPLLPSETGFPAPKRVLGYSTDCTGATSLAPVFYTGIPDTAGSTINISAQGPFNNFGIPGIRTIDYLLPGYANLAASFGFPYAKRMFTSSVWRPLDELRLNNPTFFTLWLGSNDVLGYALSGGEEVSTMPIHPNNISDPTQARAAYDSVLYTLTRNGSKGVLLNLPDITTIPFFTTIPANGLTLDTATAAALNGAYAGTGMAFHTGANYFIIQDIAAPAGMRQLKKDELLLLSLPQDSLKCAGWGSMKPIPKSYVLDRDELTRITNFTTNFNTYIATKAVSMNLPLVDINNFLRTTQTGYKYNGVLYTTQFISGGAFALDGVHLTPRGNALVANQIITAINGFYKTTIPLIDIHTYPGIRFPL
ncbi:MAG TPA: SGNH/GDSL hydrolase family protein [Flavipsychrobacter sp.]|nr:SGNH/GDSL hydrolase family protein [Flavipsychrobacter sp.]